MTEKTIREAMGAAKEFQRRATIVLDDREPVSLIHIGWGNKNTAALRRQSMELTRLLAKMRQ